MLRFAPLVVLACACQAVLGDFTVEPAPAEEPAPVLGTECEPEEYRCNEAVLERCADDRRGFIAVETCANSAECNLNARTCRPCTAGEHMCRGAALELCENSAWQLVTDCEPPARCSVAENLMTGECTPPDCAPGVHECAGPQLLRCSERGDEKEFVALCENNELCDPLHADALFASGLPARCQPAECAPNAFRCEGGTHQVCAPDRTGWIDRGPCDSEDLCSAANGTCGACTPGEIECNGAVLRSCAETGVWETLDTCEIAALCDAEEGRCQKAECHEPGALRCGGTPVLERCSDDLLWEEFQACANEGLCSVSAGRCLTPACAVDETRCRGAEFERCSGDRTRWVIEATCGAGELCDAENGCMQGGCTEGMVRCNGSSLERCVGGGVEILQLCATASLCDEAMAGCRAPVCGPGPEFECDERITRRCLPGRDAFDEFFTCEVGLTCTAPPGAGRYDCQPCTPDDYECSPDATALLRCSSDGKGYEKVQSCPTLCMIAGDGAPDCQ